MREHPARSDRTFSSRLKLARSSLDLSQAELAARAGLQPAAISHFENGQRRPSFENLRRLSDALEVTTDFLLGRVDEAKAVGQQEDRLHRNFSALSADYQAVANDFVEMLAQRSTGGSSPEPGTEGP